MPITEFQKQLLHLIKSNRNPDSYVAGGTAIHRAKNSARYSNDIDFFHETEEAIARSVKADLEVLQNNGCKILPLIQQPGFVRVVVERGNDSLKLEWVRDTAYRFFPVVEDDELGYRLHDVDLAVNKSLALANRNEVRDIVDLIQIDRTVLCLAAICWAACGKDPGFTPDLLLDCMRKNSIIRPEQLAAEALHEAMSPTELKKQWLALLEKASSELPDYPADELGCIYIDDLGDVVVSPRHPLPKNIRPHYGTVGGSIPQLA
jgi:hypothetical protein